MAPELSVRPVVYADTAALSAFAARTFREAFGHMVPPDAMAQYLQDSFHEARVADEIADPDTVFFIAADASGEFAGYCKLFFGVAPPAPNPGGGRGEARKVHAPVSPDASADSAASPGLGAGGTMPKLPVKLWRLYTAREWQGRGVGAQLLEYAAMIARKRGGGTLWLTVNTGNTGAVRFYERNGFVQTGFTTFDLGGEIQRDFVMERDLSRPLRAERTGGRRSTSSSR